MGTGPDGPARAMRTYFRDGRWRSQTMTSVIRERAELRMHRAEREQRRVSHGVRRELGEPPFVEDLREKYYVGDDWITLELVANDGRERWAVYDKDEMLHAHVWGKDEAVQVCKQLKKLRQTKSTGGEKMTSTLRGCDDETLGRRA